MIGKILPHRSDFGGITRYALYGRQKDNPERVEWLAMRNLDGVAPEVAHRVMEATSRKSKRVEKPRGHMVISWARNDHVSNEEMISMVDQVMAEMGLSGLQAMYVAHNDTDHRHVHAIFNRVHPDTGRVASDSFERLKLRRSLMGIEQEYGLEQTPFQSRGLHEEQLFSDIEIARRAQVEHYKRMSKQRCDDLREGLAYTFERANSWRHLDELLEARGYELQAAGPGVRIVRHNTYAKLSDVLPPKMNTKKLIQRWGKFSDYHRQRVDKEHEKQRQRHKLEHRQRRRQRHSL